MASLKIFTLLHQPPRIKRSSFLFSDLVTGSYSCSGGSWQGDLDGINISRKNTHSEMRGQYFVWKNLCDRYEYIGFEHQRRKFFLDFMGRNLTPDINSELFNVRRREAVQKSEQTYPVSSETFSFYVAQRSTMASEETDHILDFVGSHDIICQRPHRGVLVRDLFAGFLGQEGWDDLIAAIRHVDINNRFDLDAISDTEMGCYCNMYIMKTSIFHEYMTLWWDVMNHLIEKRGEPDRQMGHFAERLLTLFLTQKMLSNPMLKVGFLPLLFCSNPEGY
ncbi:DUF4422 domain-containing protein [Acetobacter estunensis]|uniref:DUF4422 domain-containing protein n=1 Tax=Acetobacter estunensis TaxID=104097 RepID=A0A967EC92_9PROT|nr:DUF4422 domain-containing protein [Acetobacter estunensis]NHO52705.1 DUF4422 domain-containing protein [Acetobacter estunensis]